MNQRLRQRNRKVPFKQRKAPPAQPKVVYALIFDINYICHFLDILEKCNPMDDEPMWAADRVVTLTLGSTITIPETANEFAIKGNHLTLIKGNKFDGRIKINPTNTFTNSSEYEVKSFIPSKELFSKKNSFLNSMALTADENSEFEFDTEEPPFKKITFNTDYKIKKSLEEPPSDLEPKPLPDILEYDQYRVIFLSLLALKDHQALVLMDDLGSIYILKGGFDKMCTSWKSRLNKKKIQAISLNEFQTDKKSCHLPKCNIIMMNLSVLLLVLYVQPLYRGG
uniref:Reverse transcriptase domain-containing protein n=1 Tax=Tanacetum cinerariifolium TaxID=118510 RepID=A0A6L2KI31_TANCI|nr:reverse transcriptase domain-containing protein [Tanacetum cinerariifolium]